MAALPDPRAAANRVKRVLHCIFEELYCFDLEDKRKKNLGPTVKWLEKMDGTSKFVVAYVVQAALGGHSIPLDAGTLAAFRVLDLATEKEAAAGEVSGLERAVSKSKGAEFGSLVHQLGADYLANPFSSQVREILLAIDPEAAKRFPQRRQPRPEAAVEPVVAEETAPPPSTAASRKKKAEAATAVAPVPETKATEAKPGESKGGEGKPAESKPTESKAAESKPAEGKKAAASKKAAEAAAEPPPAVKAHEKPAKPEKPEKVEKAEKPEKVEKPARQEKPEKQEKRPVEAAKTPTSDGLGKRKPR